ncbi:ThiF family adenylyltransferase, partial [Alicyclobacillus sendaiensis]|uniref:ThiF family adenylyltransferase n=1 Tax=Alicyclobacillus sendaiensis TaxID=192387 RepID=UPI0026F414F2
MGFDFHQRYSRQIRFRHIGEQGQARIASSRVAFVGIGAIGTASAAQLARAGVGYLRLIDRDIVEPSNLQRQILYTEEDARAGRPKAVAARDALLAANASIAIDAVVDDVDSANAESLLADVDVIVDGSDNFEVRYLVNDVAVKHGLPWAYAGAVEAHGTSAFLRPGRTPCLVCLLGRAARVGHDTCDTVGVISPIVQWMASYQVAEVLKYLAGQEDALSNAILQADLWNTDVRLIRMGGPKPNCPCCAKRVFAALGSGRRALSV